ncbi:hypothetical protein [Sphingomonas sp. SRS2]|uniref:hypothetical protein n=1 Tax=Sphingomonas sp. SRS2 TaxID=133190 RepID=UPI0006184745|nr:hypothetical protein [Sphingomonas sp. SRS2]KKC23732.1 hypothetical protein WP12_23230 [Sphingomonas sp. SRS2]
MQDPIFWLTISGAGLIGVAVLAWTALSGWRGWLELERMKLAGHHHAAATPSGPSPAARIELADLKERVRKLEAIAAWVDL